MHMKQEFGIGPKEVTPRTSLIITRCEKNILALKKIRRAVCFSRQAVDFQLYRNTSKTQRNMYRWVWRIVSPRRAGEAGPRARGGSDAEEEGAVREGLREARETRAAGNREDARQGEGVPRGRPGDRPRAVDGRRRGAPRRPARHRRDGGDGRGRDRGDTGRPAARAVARADRGHEARAGARRVHDMPPGGRRARRDDQHGAEAEGRLRARAQVGAGRGGPPLGAGRTRSSGRFPGTPSGSGCSSPPSST